MAQVSLPNTLLNNTTADASQVMADLNALLAGVNNIDVANLTNALAALVGLNVAAGPQKRGVTNIATAENTASTTYTTLTTPDQVTGLVVPANGVIAVSFQATFLETVAGAGRVAIFIGSNQLVIPQPGGAPVVQEAGVTNATYANTATPLSSCAFGLAVANPTGVGASGHAYTGDVTTGQVLGIAPASQNIGYYAAAAATESVPLGGECLIDNLPAGTYNIAIKCKTSSGTMTLSSRRLRAEVRNYQ